MSNYPIVTMRLLIQFNIIAYIDPNFIYVNSFFSDLGGNLQQYGDFTWRLSDCEELVAPSEKVFRQKCD